MSSRLVAPGQKFKQDKRKKIASGKDYLRSMSVFKEALGPVREQMKEDFQSGLVKDLKSSNYILEREGITMYLAKEFGFCWGVERSIELAFAAVEKFPDRKVHITNELIHNPLVNDQLHDKNVNFIEKTGENGGKDFSDIESGDVVMLPAFGASLEELEHFDAQDVKVVDTTCPWVARVWNTVHQHQVRGLTSVIHGKWGHEETIATKSYCEDYIIVKDLKEANMVTDYILESENALSKADFLEFFKNAISEGFDPDVHLKKIGLANQTTMYKKETGQIGKLLQRTMIAAFGPEELNDRYYEFDTICDATQVRQDAVSELCETHEEVGLDFILVVGGWDSSNTAHLLEIPQLNGIRSFHINEPGCIGADNKLSHRMVDGSIATEEEFLPLGNLKNLKIGVTSGASTPDRVVQDSMSRIFLLKDALLAGAGAEDVALRAEDELELS